MSEPHIPTPEEGRVKPWFAVDGDNSLRVDYDLNENSLVYDIGGYKGDWAEAIYVKYGCTVEVFEPVKGFVDILHNRFSGNKSIHIYEFGLSGKTEKAKISLEEASSSLFKSRGSSESIQLKAANEVIGKNLKIDLMKMNIEAGEYALLDNLIEHDLVKNIENIQIQFHVFIDNYDRRRRKIQKELTKTHVMTYNYPYIWENWRRKQ